MRRANKQTIPASTPVSSESLVNVRESSSRTLDTRSGRIPVQRSRYLQETYALKTGKRPLLPVSATIISKHVLSPASF